MPAYRSATKTADRRTPPGFTLIEVLMATVILALIMSVGYGSLSHIIKGKNLLDDQRDNALIGDAIIMRLTRELQLAYDDGKSWLIPPPNEADGRSPQTQVMEGEPGRLENGQRGDRLTFLALEGGQYLPDGGQHTGMVQITYRVEEDPEQTAGGSNRTYYLIRDEIPYLRPAEKAYKKIMTFPITARLVRLQFDYYDPKSEGWVSTWGKEAQPKLPSMIRFSVSIASPAGRVETYTTAVYVRAEPE